MYRITLLKPILLFQELENLTQLLNALDIISTPMGNLDVVNFIIYKFLTLLQDSYMKQWQNGNFYKECMN